MKIEIIIEMEIWKAFWFKIYFYIDIPDWLNLIIKYQFISIVGRKHCYKIKIASYDKIKLEIIKYLFNESVQRFTKL